MTSASPPLPCTTSIPTSLLLSVIPLPSMMSTSILPRWPLHSTPLQVHPIPLSDIKALRKHTPTLGHHHVTLTLASGVSLPSFFFQNVSPGSVWEGLGGEGWGGG